MAQDEDKKRAERDRRLDELKQATEKWAEAELKRIDHEVDFLKSVLQGRTGAGRLATKTQSAAKTLVVESLRVFMEG